MPMRMQGGRDAADLGGDDRRRQRREYRGGNQGQRQREGLGVAMGRAGRDAGRRGESREGADSRAGDSPRRSCARARHVGAKWTQCPHQEAKNSTAQALGEPSSRPSAPVPSSSKGSAAVYSPRGCAAGTDSASTRTTAGHQRPPPPPPPSPLARRRRRHIARQAARRRPPPLGPPAGPAHCVCGGEGARQGAGPRRPAVWRPLPGAQRDTPPQPPHRLPDTPVSRGWPKYNPPPLTSHPCIGGGVGWGRPQGCPAGVHKMLKS